MKVNQDRKLTPITSKNPSSFKEIAINWMLDARSHTPFTKNHIVSLHHRVELCLFLSSIQKKSKRSKEEAEKKSQNKPSIAP